MNARDFLDYLPPSVRTNPGWQLIAETLRVDAEFRALYTREGSAGFSTDLDIGRIDEILGVLRSLPDDAPRERISAALAPFRRQRHDSA